MNNRRLKLLRIPLIITAIFLAAQAFLLVNRFGFFSVIEEVPLDFKKTNQQDVQLLKGQKVSASFKANEDNLGIVLIKLVKFGQGKDNIVFRIKKEGKDEWHHESKFFGGQINDNKYFPLGFPPIINSKNNRYIFELESLAGSTNNGIGVIKDKPIGAVMYKYSIGELMNYKILYSFTVKKFIYVVKNINYWQTAIAFALLWLITIAMKKRNISLFNIGRFLIASLKNPGKIPRIIISRIKPSYPSFKKKIIYLSKKIAHWFTSSKVYSQFLNTTAKKRIVIGLLIFTFAFIYRYSAYIADVADQSYLFYSLLGGGGDYDQFIKAATCALDFCSRIIHQNLLVESVVLGVFYEFFGFIGGIKAYLYLMLTASSIVATLPYILLSRKSWLSVGGVVGSLLLATNDFLTQAALNYPPDNGSTFIFSMFFIVYLLTMHLGTIRWLIAFGLIGLLDGMFKAMFLINDVVVLALFAPVFFYEKTRKTALPRAKQLRVILIALLPLLIFLILYSAWEYIVEIKFDAPYFLRLLIETGGSNFRFETLFYSRSSGEAEQDIILQLFYLLISGVVMIKRIVSLSDLQIIFLAPIFFGLLFFSLIKRSPVKLITIFLLSFVNIALLISVKNNYLDIHQIFAGEYIYANWSLQTYISIFLFVEIIFLFLLNFKYQAFKLALPIVPYVIMLIILTKNAPWLRLLAHVIVWSIILFSFLFNWILVNTALFSNQKIKNAIGLIALILFMSFYSFPRTQEMVTRLNSSLENLRSQTEYLRWVNSSLPENAIILGGKESDLVTLGENISRPIVYNTSWAGAVLIRPDEISGVSPDDFNLINELKNKRNFMRNKYFILEEDIELWRDRISGVGDGVFTTDPEITTALHAQDYSIEVYKTNQELKKNIYELRPQDVR